MSRARDEKFTQDDARWRDLMTRAQQGDADAYRTLLSSLFDVVEAYLRRILGSSPMVEDCVQEALMAVHRARHTYDPRRPFRPWLFTIVRHKAIDALRRDAARPEDASEMVSERAPARRDDPVALLEAGRLLDGLNPEFRNALLLTKVQGLTIDEAAREAGVTAPAMRTRVHRAIKKLNHRMERDLAAIGGPPGEGAK